MNDPPIAVDDVANTDANTPITVVVLTNDSDPNGDPITVTGASASNGTVVINGVGSITYTPSTGFCGTDTIFYTICDPEPLFDNAIVLVTVECPPVNDPPIAVDDSTGTEPDTPLLIDVLDNDSDPNGDPLTVTSADASNGTVVINSDGTLSYTPTDGFCGVDTITYVVCDQEPLCDGAFVFITIECPDKTVLVIPEGVSPNNRTQIFDSFFTTRRDSGGTGMGLAIVRAMLDAHGGAVRLIESDHGTAFELTFPLTDAAAS